MTRPGYSTSVPVALGRNKSEPRQLNGTNLSTQGRAGAVSSHKSQFSPGGPPPDGAGQAIFWCYTERSVQQYTVYTSPMTLA